MKRMKSLVLVLLFLGSVRKINTQSKPAQATTTDLPSTVTHADGTDADFNTTTDVTLTTLEINSTKMPNTTPAVPKSGAKPKRTEIDMKASKHTLCTCDLQLNFCDINCCCDEECSSNDKLVFHHCETEERHYDTRYCEYMKYIYINNTPFEWQVNQNGLFCIIKSNLPPSYTIQRKHPLKTFDAAKSEKRNKFTWPNYDSGGSGQISVFNESEKFLYGNHVWLVRRNGISKFQLPNKFITNRCIIDEDVFNMKNMENICSQTDISEDNPYLTMKSFFEDMYVIAAPSLVNVSKYTHGIFQDCPRNVCLPVAPKICDKLSNICVDVTKNDTRSSVKCNFSLRENKNVCVNVVQGVEYNFYHGYMGFTGINVSFTLENISYAFGKKEMEFIQKFSVNFWWNNQTNNFSESMSGSPGYLIGKPILTAKLVNVGNKTWEVLKIKRNPSRYLENFLTIPDNLDGYCVSNEKSHVTIEFGYNLLTRCKFEKNISSGNKKVNATEICRKIQTSLLELWGLSEYNKMIGSFGNANANILSDWLKILYEIDPQLMLNKTLGIFIPKSSVIVCSGLATNLIIDIYHSKIDIDNLMNQEKILAVTYSFGVANESLVFNNNTRSVRFALDLDTRVIFNDITSTKQKRMVDAPSLDIKLPYDFFYPFIKINNGIVHIAPTWIIWYNIVLLRICYF